MNLTPETWAMNDKAAVITKTSKGYEIDFYDDEQQSNFVAKCVYYNKSIFYVRDAAENWITDIFKIEDLKRHEKRTINNSVTQR